MKEMNILHIPIVIKKDRYEIEYCFGGRERKGAGTGSAPILKRKRGDIPYSPIL